MGTCQFVALFGMHSKYMGEKRVGEEEFLEISESRLYTFKIIYMCVYIYMCIYIYIYVCIFFKGNTGRGTTFQKFKYKA